MHIAHTKAVVALLLGILLGGCASAPPYQGMSADQLFELGSQRFQEEDWGKAAEIFERLVFAEPGYPRIVEARMYMARAYYNRSDYITAVAEFTRVLDRHPGHPLAPEASLGICKSYVAQSPHVQRDQSATLYAWNSCVNTVSDFRNHPVAEEAGAVRDEMEGKLAEKLFIAGDFYFRRKFFHSGIIFFSDLLMQYPRNEWAAKALLRLHQSYEAMDWDTEAEEVKARLLREFPDSEAAREVRSDGGDP
jgi:outer membrane protein assembly factor BamD